MEQLAQGVFQTDATGRLTLVNAAWHRVTGLSVALGELFWKPFHPDDAAEMEAAFAANASGARTSLNCRARCVAADGAIRWLELRGNSASDGSGRFCGCVGTLEDVTESHEADSQLRHSRRRVDRILSSLNAVIWSVSGQSYKPLYLNAAAERLYGRPVAEFYRDPELWLKVIHPADRKRVLASMPSFRETGSCDLEYRIVRPDGSVLWVRDRGRMSYDSRGKPERLDGVVVDITARRLAEDAQRAAEERLRGIAASIPGMVFQLQEDASSPLAFTYASEGSRSVCGLSPAELVERPGAFLELVHSSDRQSLLASLASARKGGRAWNWQGRLQLDGEEKWVNLRARAARQADGSVLWNGVALNVTREHRSTEQLERSRRELRELSSHLQSVREAERARIAREIHDELGATLTAIKLDLSWCARQGGKGESIRERTAHAMRMIDSAVGAVRRITTDLRPSILDHLGLWAAIEWQVQSFQQRTGMRCDLELNVDDVQPDAEHATAIFRILQEALTNIVRHAQATRACVRVNASPDRVFMEVADNGRGVSDAQIEDARSYGILGMRERAAAFGGALRIAGIPGLGSTLYASFPLASFQTADP